MQKGRISGYPYYYDNIIDPTAPTKTNVWVLVLLTMHKLDSMVGSPLVEVQSQQWMNLY